MAEVRKLDTKLSSSDMSTLTFHLLNDHLFLPDTLREYPVLLDSIKRVLSTSPDPYGIYSDGLCGTFFMTDIIRGHEARFLLWLWDKEGLRSSVIRQIRDYLDYMQGTYELVRVVSQTADPRMGRILKKSLGFKEEARFAMGYKHGGAFSTLMQYRKLMEE